MAFPAHWSKLKKFYNFDPLFSGKVDQKLIKPLHLLHLVYITYQKCIIFSKKGQKNGPNHLFFSDLIHFNSTNQSPRPYNCVNYTQKTKSLFCSSFQTKGIYCSKACKYNCRYRKCPPNRYSVLLL